MLRPQYQLLLAGEWTNLRKGEELPDGCLAYVRRTGATGIAKPKEWRVHAVPSVFEFTPAKRKGWLRRLFS